MNSENELIARCQHGDDQAFDELITLYQSYVYDLAYTILRDDAEAQDIVQDVFLRIYQRLPDFRGTSTFKTWLTTIAVNKCRDRLRRRKIREALSLEHLTKRWLERKGAVTPPLEAAIEQKQQWDLLWEMVDQLEEKYRLVIILHYRYDLSGTELGDVLNIAKTTAYTRLSQGRKKLWALLQSHQTEIHQAKSEELLHETEKIQPLTIAK